MSGLKQCPTSYINHTRCVEIGSYTLLQAGSSLLGLAGSSLPWLCLSQKLYSSAVCRLHSTVNAYVMYIVKGECLSLWTVNTVNYELKNYSSEPVILVPSYCPELADYKTCLLNHTCKHGESQSTSWSQSLSEFWFCPAIHLTEIWSQKLPQMWTCKHCSWINQCAEMHVPKGWDGYFLNELGVHS